MLTSASALTLLSLIGSRAVEATAIGHYRPQSPCTSFMLQVPITANNHIFDVVPVNNNIDAVNWAIDLDTWNEPAFPKRILENITISRTYDIFATLCIPPHGSKASNLQIATHGGGFDSRYWDPSVDPDEHSWVNAALNAGYSILTYDRIGCGQSSKPNAYTDMQHTTEVEVLRVLTEKVRDGTIQELASRSHRPLGPTIAFDKIIHVGHSMGSIVTYALISLYPNASDAVILTGFLVSSQVFNGRTTAGGREYAPENDPKLFANHSSGYVVIGTPLAFQTGFFSNRTNETTNIGGFKQEFLNYAFSVRQPESVVEMGSGVTLVLGNPTAPQFTGPVQIVLGEFDFIVCRGDCKGTYNMTDVENMFPVAKDVSVHLQPGTGHGLPLHNNATLGFKASLDWLSSQGF
ncbi:hypothetical protein LTR17_019248 [Elasticomyces elasticus]|nr:hypothetical protein LTR17_019248 [Elasticomyces elasticus]